MMLVNAVGSQKKIKEKEGVGKTGVGRGGEQPDMKSSAKTPLVGGC